MTPTILIALAVPFACIVAVFYLAGRLVRRRMQMPDAPAHWFLDDARELEDAFVDFFASSRTSKGVLGVLAAHGDGIGFKALSRELQGNRPSAVYHGEMPHTAVRAVLKILLSAGLARMRAGGFSITDLGREVQRRIRDRDGGNDATESIAPSQTEEGSQLNPGVSR